MVVGGEACPVEVVDRWAPGRVMINAYGPTETTMCACDECAADGGVGGGADRLRRCRGRRCLCWMAWLRPVPAGVVGELYVAGRGVGVWVCGAGPG